MPPKKPARSVPFESQMAERIRLEREQRGWSLDGLAKRVSDAGCPLDRSAIYKIERGDRRITLDEAGALALVFGTSIDRLMQPAAVVASKRAQKLFDQYVKLLGEIDDRHRELERIRHDVLALEDGHPGEVLEAMAALEPDAGDRETALKVWRLAESGQTPVIVEMLDHERRRIDAGVVSRAGLREESQS